ncbi:MAG: hypothetical protein WCD86_24480 [Ktedonobacteraceae bacterium]
MDQDTMTLPIGGVSPMGKVAQQAAQPDYHTLKALADLSGLRFMVVYRLSRGQRVRELGAWERYLGARLVLQQRGSWR